MTKEDFVKTFGGMYEHSPWAAELAWEEDLTSPCCIIPAMRRVVDAASAERQDQLICAHPDLAGKLALSGELTKSSTSEQAGAGLDQCSPRELKKFQKYNAAYKEKFGFPFIIAVKGLSRKDILKSFKKRLKNNKDQERQTALEQIHKIARLRIESYFDEQS
jgi:OHCU decarboxylase